MRKAQSYDLTLMQTLQLYCFIMSMNKVLYNVAKGHIFFTLLCKYVSVKI